MTYTNHVKCGQGFLVSCLLYLFSRLSVEDLEHLNEDGELWFAYEGLKKATRVLESHFQSQKDCYEKEIEGLNFKVVHLSQEINHLQKLFREETDINESIRHEVTRLTSENMVRPHRACLSTLSQRRSSPAEQKSALGS
ncbi:myosin VC (predicted), isoform CRA_c [Rattus norvegicus]|uniref:Myosin VC (Predicted), isoform CRA_c n=1 Tax=Rattus norvegicus TaxID=10116 RepID=A6I1B9_RAT|nr:myosin VC (predicted), isoform CRA_c [Rattus norvegicus]